MRSALLSGVALGVIPAAWLTTASWIWCAGTRTAFDGPYMEWLDAVRAGWWHENWWCKLWIGLGALGPTTVIAIGIAIAVAVYNLRRTANRQRLEQADASGPPRVQRSATDNHGHSNWRSMESAKELFPGPDEEYGGIVVGEAYRVDLDTVAGVRFDSNNPLTWGMGGKADLLIDPCREGSTHSLDFAGPGQFKSTSAIPTIKEWIGSCVVLDPSQELGPMCDRMLRAQGKNVVHIGIKGGERSFLATGIDVLAWINTSHPEAESHVREVVSWIYDEEAASKSSKSDDPFFMPMGRELVTCLLTHMLWDTTPGAERASLKNFAKGMALSEEDMPILLGQINKTSQSPMARRIASQLGACKADETFSGVYMNAVKGTAWLGTDAYANLVSDNSFDPKQLLRGDTTVFLNISLQTLKNTPAVGRVLAGALLNTVYMADGDLTGRVLFLFDEAARLGNLGVLEIARDAGRKYGITLRLLYQSMGQLLQTWTHDGAKSWIDACSWISYGSIRAGGAGKELSDELGTYGVISYSEGSNQGRNTTPTQMWGSKSRGTNTTISETVRKVMTAAELQQDMRTDEQIIVPASGLPIRCGRPIYFRRSEMTPLIDRNRFVKVRANEKAREPASA